MLLQKSFLQELQKLRQNLHQNPEIAGEEKATSKMIQDFVSQYKPDEVVTDIGGHGLAVIYNGSEQGPVLMFRCELDALPIHEDNDLSYKSVNKGKGHKCGHDGHMVMVAGLAKLMHDRPLASGKVILLFQPAEETGEGAERILKDKKFKKLEPDYIFALHNLPGYKKNQILIKKDTFAAASKGLIIELTGKTSHAAEPQNGNSPILAMAELMKYMQNLSENTKGLKGFSLSTVVHARLGSRAFGTSPGEGVVMSTIRAYADEDLKTLESTARNHAKDLAGKYDLKLEISDTESFSSTINDSKCVDYIKEAADELDAEIKIIENPFRWTEDFGLFTQNYKGALFGLGSGEDVPNLHNPDYDFPDDIMATGINVFYNIITKILDRGDT